MNSSQQLNTTRGFAAINLACGDKICFNSGWVNADHKPINKHVQKINVLKKLPFHENTFDVVYHSQLLEHLTKDMGLSFLTECHRILKPGGIVRVVTPDLYNQTSAYQIAYKNLASNPENESFRLQYEWIKAEMLDQLCRNTSGGNMVELLNKHGNSIYDYLWSRMGRSGKNLVPMNGESGNKEKYKNIAKHCRQIVIRAIKVFFPRALIVGKFRLSGEVHLTMYDELSLTAILNDSGFKNIKRMGALESQINNWNRTLLDCDPSGYPDCGTSLFMEASKK